MYSFAIVGYPGGAILPVFDAIYNSRHFDFILPKHEQGAGHMAQGYARASGKPGVVLVTSGPGATNVVTPMQDALSDGTPMVVFCGQVATSAIGSDGFQEADVLGISRSCTKWNVMVKSIAELPRRINEAFEIAVNGRPGPVLLDLPRDITGGVLRKAIPVEASSPRLPTLSRTSPEMTPKESATLRRVANLINIAKKPVIYAGQGANSHRAAELLKELADKASIPVTTTLHGLGAFDQRDEKSLHMLGMHGTGYANMAMQNADLIIALGARFDDRVTLNVNKFAPVAREASTTGTGGIIHIDILLKNINKVVQATEAIQGDVSETLTHLLPHIQPRSIPTRKAWFDQIRDWKTQFPLSVYTQPRQSHSGPGPGPGSEPINPPSLLKSLSDLTSSRGQETILTTGVGQHQMWTAQHFRFRKPRSFVSSGGLGTMGYGLPSAIGAQIARPDALVIDIDGDASFNMTLTELSTAVQFGVPIKVLILNNREQGMVTQWQNLFYGDRFAHTHHLNPDFVGLANAMGVKGRRVEKGGEVDGALEWLVNVEGVALLEVVTDKKVPVLPMVPGGKGLDEFLTWDEEGEKRRREVMRERTGGVHG